MAITFTKPIIDTTPPEANISNAEKLRLQAANDAKVNAIGTAVESLVTQVNGSATSDDVKFTADGGLAVKLINKTGAASVKGTVVAASTGTEGAFILSAIDSVDPIGVVFEEGIADGSACWVTVAGKAKVLFTTNVTKGQFCRVPEAGDTGEAAGYAVSAAPPANPNVAVESHFREIGHALQATSAGALTLIMLHFN